MVEDQNPFTPGFGLTPSVLAGRAVVIEEFSKALAGDVPGRRTPLISGPRGSGKTVVLTEFESIAEEAGWATITLHTASASMPEELRGEVISRLHQSDPRAVTSSLTGGGYRGCRHTVRWWTAMTPNPRRSPHSWNGSLTCWPNAGRDC